MRSAWPARLRSLICSLIHSMHIGIKRPKVQAHASECYRSCCRPLGVPSLSDQLAAVAVTMGERLGSDDTKRSAHNADYEREDYQARALLKTRILAHSVSGQAAEPAATLAGQADGQERLPRQPPGRAGGCWR
jgi:hypothetical protein